MAVEQRAVNRKQRVGTVVSDGADKTIVVTIGRAARHRLYHKVIRRTKRYHVHDPENVATMGDLVRIEECRPISKTKRWRLVEVLTERIVAEVAPESLDRDFVSEVQRTAARAAVESAEAAGESVGAADSSPEPAQAATAAKPAAESSAADGDTDGDTDGGAEDADGSVDAPADEETNTETESDATETAADAETRGE